MESPALALLLDFPEGEWMPAGLRRDLGDHFTPRIVRLLAELQLTRFPNNWPAEVHVAPGGRVADVRTWLGSKPLVVNAQLEGPTSERLTQVFAEMLARHGTPVVVVRPDCPYCGVEILFAAATALEETDAVFGPSTDGDFYLLGLRALPADFFDDVNWGTNQVQLTLVQRWAAAGRSYTMLDPLERVREEASWNRAVERLAPKRN